MGTTLSAVNNAVNHKVERSRIMGTTFNMVVSAVNNAVNHFENDTMEEYSIFTRAIVDTIPGARLQDNNILVIPFSDNHYTSGYISIDTFLDRGCVRIAINEFNSKFEFEDERGATTYNNMVTSHIASIFEDMKQSRVCNNALN